MLDEQKEYYSLERRLDVLADNDQKWSIQDVASNYLADRFSRIRSKRPNFGFSRAAYWLRFEVTNKGAEEKRLLLEVGFPLIDHVDLGGGPYSLDSLSMGISYESILFS